MRPNDCFLGGVKGKRVDASVLKGICMERNTYIKAVKICFILLLFIIKHKNNVKTFGI